VGLSGGGVRHLRAEGFLLPSFPKTEKRKDRERTVLSCPRQTHLEGRTGGLSARVSLLTDRHGGTELKAFRLSPLPSLLKSRRALSGAFFVFFLVDVDWAFRPLGAKRGWPPSTKTDQFD